MAQGATAGRGASPGARFALAKFRPTTLPATLVTRSVPHDQPTAGASRRLTGYHDGRGQPIQQAIATMMGAHWRSVVRPDLLEVIGAFN